MKLQELDALRPTERVARVLENQTGKSFDFNKVAPTRAAKMLSRVQSLLREYRRQPTFHISEHNPEYLKLVMMEQALSQQMSAPATSPATNDPKTKSVMDKVARGQALTPDEQKTMNKIALAKEGQVTEKYMGFEKLEKSIAKRGDVRDPGAVAAAIGRKKYGKERFQKAAAAGKKLGESRLVESELQQAQVVLAAQDMIDRVQGMLEDVSEMQFKDLPALTDSIKNDMGADQATQFQSATGAALNQLISALQQGKTELESAQGILTGQAPVVPGAESDIEADLQLPPADEIDTEIDIDSEEEPTASNLGRERR